MWHNFTVTKWKILITIYQSRTSINRFCYCRDCSIYYIAHYVCVCAVDRTRLGALPLNPFINDLYYDVSVSLFLISSPSPFSSVQVSESLQLSSLQHHFFLWLGLSAVIHAKLLLFTLFASCRNTGDPFHSSVAAVKRTSCTFTPFTAIEYLYMYAIWQLLANTIGGPCRWTVTFTLGLLFSGNHIISNCCNV